MQHTKTGGPEECSDSAEWMVGWRTSGAGEAIGVLDLDFFVFFLVFFSVLVGATLIAGAAIIAAKASCAASASVSQPQPHCECQS